MSKHRVIAVYLPQYHPIPLNDKWNGIGFTEWTNVIRAKPRFKGHYQPHLPTDLGFYDLRNSEIREKQVDLAKEHGIFGFAYYHYWFSGQRLLNYPIDKVLEEGKPDFPFCFIWANKSWKIKKDTHNPITILEQKHDFEDDIKHINFLKPFFLDNRYIKINGKPLFIIYDSGIFPDIKKTINIWRNEALKIGIGEIYLARWERDGKRINPSDLGFDISIEFQPDMTDLPKIQKANYYDAWIQVINATVV